MYCGSQGQTDERTPSDADAVTRTLESEDLLFKAGERKTAVYRVESGVICLYDPHWNGDKALLNFIFPGDLVGFGFLERHIFTARAVAPTRVVRLSSSEVDKIVAGEPRQAAKLAEAIEHEFHARRDLLSDPALSKTVERVASLLVNLSCSNVYEGRDPHFIVDCWDCGTIADMLDLTLAEYMGVLVELEARNLIEPVPSGGLQLKDIEALEVLADGPAKSTDTTFAYERRSRPPKVPMNWPTAA